MILKSLGSCRSAFAGGSRETWEYLLKFLAKVLVEPSVNEWIVTGAAHSEAVRHEKTESIVGPIVGRRVEIVGNVDDIEG